MSAFICNFALLITLYAKANLHVQGYAVYDLDTNQAATIVNEHNRLRALEPATNMQEMVWDWDLARVAKDWASRCMATHRSDRRNQGGYNLVGENIWWSNEPYLRSDLGSIVRSFYDEKWGYSFSNGACRGQCGHYTQVVWATSCAVGCAAAYCDRLMYGRGINYGHIIVCNYGPAGNWVGQKPYTYGTQCASCPGQCRNGLCPSTCSGSPVPAPAPIAVPAPAPIARPAPAVAAPRPAPAPAPVAVAPPAPPISPVPPTAPVQMKANRPAYCVDRHTLCPFWATLSECTKNSVWMRSNCYGSCNQFECTGVVANQTPECTDSSPYCSQWAALGECTTNSFYMNWQCRKSCNLCR